MEFKFSDLFFQNSISVKGPGFPFLRELSGSYFRTFLIYLVHVIIAPKIQINEYSIGKKEFVTYLLKCELFLY